MDFLEGAFKDFPESVFFSVRKMTEDEINIAEFLANFGIVCAEAEAGKIFGAKVIDDRLETVVATTRAMLTETSFTER